MEPTPYVNYWTCVQVKKELNGKPLREAMDDHTLPVCWKGRKPFRSIYDVRKYFKPLGLSFPGGWRSKPKFEILPESYLILSVRQFYYFIQSFTLLLLWAIYWNDIVWINFCSDQRQCLLRNTEWHRDRAAI